MRQQNSIVSGRYPAIGDHRGWMLRGFRDGFPIAMGYFAVSFALGIAARNVGMNAVQGFLMSLGMVASAGEYAAIMLIGAGAGVLEMIATTVVINLRYFLMSCSLTQKLDPKTPLWKRFLLAYCVTDELFGISSAVPGYLDVAYTYAATAVSVSGWCLGTGRPVRNVPRHHHPAREAQPLHGLPGGALHGRELDFHCRPRPSDDLLRLPGHSPHPGYRRYRGPRPSC